MSFGRPYKFTKEVPHLGEVEVQYTMHPNLIPGTEAPRVEWTIPEHEPLSDEQVALLDPDVSEACFTHWKENAGNYEQPGVQGGEQP